jgi:hypothetical protein
MRRALLTALASLATLAVVLALPVAADANTRTFRDQRHDVANSNDIVRYAVSNGRRVVLATWHRDLTRKALDIQFLMKNSRNGRVYHAYATLNGRANYVGQVGSGDFTKCPGLRVSRNLSKDKATLSVPRDCLGNPQGRLKLRARVQWSIDGSRGDWAPNHGYSGWVAR